MCDLYFDASLLFGLVSESRDQDNRREGGGGDNNHAAHKTAAKAYGRRYVQIVARWVFVADVTRG